MTSGINKDEWMAAIKAACDQPPPPTDAITILEFAEMIGVERSQASKRMHALVRQGLAEVTKKQTRRGGEIGHWVWVPAYRLLKKAEVAHGDSPRGRDARRPRRGSPRRRSRR